MNERNELDESLSKFLEGTAIKEENEQISVQLDENVHDLLAMMKATRLVDQSSQIHPDMVKAQQQIHAELQSNEKQEEKIPTLSRRLHIRKLVTIAAAVVAVLLLMKTIFFFVFRSNHNEKLIAQQNVNLIDSVSNVGNEEKKTTDETKQIVDNNGTSPLEKDIEKSSLKTELQHNTYISQVNEKNYATTKEANSLIMKRPDKSTYTILCKNLDKMLTFEWTASNIKNLHFLISDSQGNVIAEILDTKINYYSLKYRDIYPNKKLNWQLSVVYSDNTQDERKGQILIDYNF